MKKHQEFTKWAVKRGVEINGVEAYRFKGRGLGVRAKKDIEPGTEIIKVPTSALITRHSVTKDISSRLPDISTHGLLATYLVLDKNSKSKELERWHAVLPSYKSFEQEMPYLWSEKFQKYLLPAATDLLRNQQAKFDRDWEHVKKAYPEMEEKDYVHAWLLVNTRTFYYTPPSTSRAKKVKLDPNEFMALVPFADYFNHSQPPHCKVTYNSEGFTITSNREIQKGEEVYISYGMHSNDFLLTEYGFIMEENEADSVKLDTIMEVMLITNERPDAYDQVKNAGFLGKYSLDKDGVCFRTQVALYACIMPPRRWAAYLTTAEASRSEEAHYEQLLETVLCDFLREALRVKRELEGLEVEREEEPIRKTLQKRWQQVLHFVDASGRVEAAPVEVLGKDPKE